MAYDEDLALRVRAILAHRKGVSERKMFGGLAFLVDGSMACGILDTQLVLRLGPEETAAALAKPHTRPMDFTGRAMTSMIYLEAAGCRREADLRAWVERAVRYARRTPPKKRRPRATSAASIAIDPRLRRRESRR